MVSIWEVIEIFCSINHGDPKCQSYMRQCMDHSHLTQKSAYISCHQQWMLNNNKTMGRCWHPDINVMKEVEKTLEWVRKGYK